MSRESYDLQGRNGWEVVSSGQAFSGESAGFQVLTDGTFDAQCRTPKQATATLGVTSLTAGIYIGGTITALEVTGGSALVYPTTSSYTIA